MNRRSVLGFLGLGATVGPSVVSQSGYAGLPVGKDLALAATSGWGTPPSSINNEKDWLLERMKETGGMLNKMLSSKEDWIRNKENEEFVRLRSYPHVDVDIAVMKSISDIGKLKMQAKRNAVTRYHSELDECNRLSEGFTKRLKEFNIF